MFRTQAVDSRPSRLLEAGKRPLQMDRFWSCPFSKNWASQTEVICKTVTIRMTVGVWQLLRSCATAPANLVDAALTTIQTRTCRGAGSREQGAGVGIVIDRNPNPSAIILYYLQPASQLCQDCSLGGTPTTLYERSTGYTYAYLHTCPLSSPDFRNGQQIPTASIY